MMTSINLEFIRYIIYIIETTLISFDFNFLFVDEYFLPTPTFKTPSLSVHYIFISYSQLALARHMSLSAPMTRFGERRSHVVKHGSEESKVPDEPMHGERELHNADLKRAEERSTRATLAKTEEKNKVANSLATFRTVVKRGGREFKENITSFEAARRPEEELANSEKVIQARLARMERRMSSVQHPNEVRGNIVMNSGNSRAMRRMGRREDMHGEHREANKFLHQDPGLDHVRYEVTQRGRVKQAIIPSASPAPALGSVEARADRMRGQKLRRSMMPSRRRHAAECAHQGSEEKYWAEQRARSQSEARELRMQVERNRTRKNRKASEKKEPESKES